MKSVQILTVALVLSGLSAQAMQGDPAAGNHGPRSELFAEFKAIESASHKERIRILQEAESCIQAAGNRDQYRLCEERENQDRTRAQEQTKAQRDALRAKAEGMKQALQRPR